MNHPALITAQQQLAQLEGSASATARFRDLPASEVKAVALQRDAKVAEDIYVLLLNRVQELSVQRAGTGGNLHIVDAALRAGEPVKPKKILIMSAAVILGVIVGVGFVFVRRAIFKGIDDPERVERMRDCRSMASYRCRWSRVKPRCRNEAHARARPRSRGADAPSRRCARNSIVRGNRCEATAHVDAVRR